MITITFIRLWYDLLEPNLVLFADMDEEVLRKKENKDNFILVSFKDFPVI